MGTAFQIFGLLAVTAGLAVIVFACLGLLAAVGVGIVGVGVTAWLIGRAMELADDMNAHLTMPSEVSTDEV